VLGLELRQLGRVAAEHLRLDPLGVLRAERLELLDRMQAPMDPRERLRAHLQVKIGPLLTHHVLEHLEQIKHAESSSAKHRERLSA